MSGTQTSSEMINQPAASVTELGTALYPVLVPGANGNRAVTKLATRAQLTASIATGTLLFQEQTTNTSPLPVAGLPVIPAAGGMCLLNGTIIAQDGMTADTAMWNVTLLVKRVAAAVTCVTVGDTTPSRFSAEGSLAELAAPSLGANSAGPVITLTGLATPVLWDINLNTTTGS